jgi:transcriptional regulator GlxA family with amidase domain
LIRQFGGRVSTEELSKKVFVCERQLQRAFRENFGISPKTYSRLVRFNRASTLLKKPGRLNWADVTYSCGYADQAHFIRDFKAFSGSNPTALISDPLSLTTMSANAEMC